MFTATKKQQHYLKQLAALQFPGSIDNLSTKDANLCFGTAASER